MASETLKTKWRIWYRNLDTNHDGVLSEKDVEFTKNQFSTLHMFDAKKREEASKEFDEWFSKFILRGLKKGESMSEDQFIEKLDEEYNNAGKKGFLADMQAMADKFKKAVSKGHAEDVMTKDDFRLLYLAYGHTNIANDHEAFNSYKPVDGKIQMSEYLKAWISFLTDDDESKDNPVRMQFERIGYL